MPSLVGIGEAMGELRPGPAGSLHLDVSGDVLNTLAYVRALGGDEWDIAFVSSVGTDPVSAALRARCTDLGIATQFHVDPVLPLGLYLITTDASGERSFTYWRSASPARQLMASMDDAARESVLSADLVLLSGITLAILDDPQRDQLAGLILSARARGARIVFDPNYRRRLWPDAPTAHRWVERFYALSDVVFPGLEDETALSGAAAASDVLARIPLAGAAEVVVKAGRAGVLARVGIDAVTAPFVAPPKVVDTTAAGDAFNAAWLVARQRGCAPATSARFAATTAAAVAAHPGAIVPFDCLPTLASFQEPAP